MKQPQDFAEVARKLLAQQGEQVDHTPWENKDCYADWVAQTYYFVCHSTRLLALAASRFDVKQDALHLRFIEHLREEKSHEKLALADLNALGVSISDYPERPETRAFYQAQYYWIEHVCPEAFFGYILALEGLAALKGPGIFQCVSKLYGAKACSFIKVHSVDDQDHLEKLYVQLGQLDRPKLELVQANLEQSCRLYSLMLEEVSVHARVRTIRKAA